MTFSEIQSPLTCKNCLASLRIKVILHTNVQKFLVPKPCKQVNDASIFIHMLARAKRDQFTNSLLHFPMYMTSSTHPIVHSR
jgi:hypothetical protein